MIQRYHFFNLRLQKKNSQIPFYFNFMSSVKWVPNEFDMRLQKFFSLGRKHFEKRKIKAIQEREDSQKSVRPLFIQSFSSNPIRLGQVRLGLDDKDWTKSFGRKGVGRKGVRRKIGLPQESPTKMKQLRHCSPRGTLKQPKFSSWGGDHDHHRSIVIITAFIINLITI